MADSNNGDEAKGLEPAAVDSQKIDVDPEDDKPAEGEPAPPGGGAAGWLRRWFKMGERRTTFLTEFRAGTATFLTLCYIITVNSRSGAML